MEVAWNGGLKVAVGVLLLTVATGALAQVAGPWYVGASVGRSEFKDACNGLPAGFSCDNKGTAGRLFGGYQFHRNWAVEFGYDDFGKATASGVVGGVGVNGSGKSSAWELTAVGSVPLGHEFSLYGKAGAYQAHTKVSATGTLGAFTATASGTDNNTGLTVGAGTMYDFTKAFQLRAEWQRYAKVGGNNTGGKNDIDVLGVGFVVKF